MWILFAFLSALFSGFTTILIKKGVYDINLLLSLFVRTTIILIISFLIVIFFNSYEKITIKTIIYLILSGISITILWISYFKAIDLGKVSEVTSIEKTSIIITMILSNIIFGEKITVIKIISSILIILGSFIMVNNKDKSSNNKWFKYAFLTAIFTSISTIISKIGLENINPYICNFYRTIVVFIIILFYTLYKNKLIEITKIKKITWLYLILSAITTSLSWVCYLYALKNGKVSIVFSIEKLNIVVSVCLSNFILKEKLSLNTLIGMLLIVFGTSILLI